MNQLKKCDQMNLLQRRKNMDDIYSQESNGWKQKLGEIDRLVTTRQKTMKKYKNILEISLRKNGVIDYL